MTILHLALARDWQAARQAGEYRVSTLGRTLEEEGFIHCSTGPAQLHGVAGRYYAHVTEPLVVLTVDDTALPVRLEVPPGATEAYPHVYGPIPVHAVTAVTPYDPAPRAPAP
jgi:uncharacterized protein (DUF952 family)